MQPTQLPQTDIFLHEDRQLDLGTGRPETGVPGWVSGLGPGLGVQVVVPGAFGNGSGFPQSRTRLLGYGNGIGFGNVEIPVPVSDGSK